MKIEYDPAKRDWTLRERGLDFDREDYGENRFLTYGLMDEVIVACIWTARGKKRRIISLRKAEKDEREIYNLYRP